MAYNYQYGSGDFDAVGRSHYVDKFSDEAGYMPERTTGKMMGGFGMDSPFVKNLFGGGGGGGTGAPSYGAGGGLGSSGAAIGGGGPAGAYTGAINRGRSSGGVGGNIPTLTSRGAAQTRAALASAPYQYEAAAQQQALDGQMAIAQMNAKAGLAAQMMQLQAEREAAWAARMDNEKNRQLQLEMQRRNFGADDYQTKQQFHYQYGI